MNQYGVKATDDRNASVFRPHEAAVNYSLPVQHLQGRLDLHAEQPVGPAGVDRPQLVQVAGPALQRSAVDLRHGDAALGRGDGQLRGHRRRRGAGRQLEPALAVRRQLHLLPPATPASASTSSRSADRSRASGTSATQELRSEGRGGAGQDYRLYYSSGAPIEVLLYNSPFTSENNVDYQGLFMRDNWRIGDRLTLNLGLRVERYDVFLPEQSKPAGPFSAPARLLRRSTSTTGAGSSPRIGCRTR